MGDIKITYNTLFELLRRERTRHELQGLDVAFYDDVVSYLKDKSSIKNTQSSSGDSMFLHEENQRQLENARRIIKHIYDKRERKIVQLAMDASAQMTSDGKKLVIDKSALLEVERKYFDELMRIMEKYRKAVLFNTLLTKEIDLPEETQHLAHELKKEEFSSKLVRFLAQVPQFIGPEMQVYGPFEKEDIASLPKKVADILVNKEKAEAIDG